MARGEAVSKTSTTSVAIDHVTITSTRAFEDVRERLEVSLPPTDADVPVLLRNGAVEAAMSALQKSPPLTIFGSRNHGALLAIAGQHMKAIQYDIGNMLTASHMTRHEISAALYAPIRVLLRQDASGTVAFEYDRPSTTFGQFRNELATEVAMELDRALSEALRSAAA